jgi:hypothetical protein
LIKVTFATTATNLLEEWRKFLRRVPTNVSDFAFAAWREVQLVSLFDSNSCIAIISLHFWLWLTMSTFRTYEFLGVIQSPDLVKLPDLNMERGDDCQAIDNQKRKSAKRKSADTVSGRVFSNQTREARKIPDPSSTFTPSPIQSPKQMLSEK